METSQSISVANRLTGFFMLRELRGFRLISGWRVFCWTCFLQIFGRVSQNLRRPCVFGRNFLAGGLGGVSVF